MKGVSEVIAIILILMITISIAGLAYTFMSSTMASTTAAASSAVDTTSTSILTSFAIENIDVAKVYIRNTGQASLTDLSVYVNDEPAVFNIMPTSIAAGSVGTVTIYSFIPDGATIKISSPTGFSTSKVANPCDKAVGCWRLDDGAGTTTYDSSPYGNSGTLMNMNIAGNATSGWTTGRYNGGLLFDKVNDYVRIGNSTVFNLSGDFTISAWIKPTGNLVDTDRWSVIGNYYTTGQGWMVDIMDAAHLLRFYNGTTNFAGGIIPVDQWTFITISYIKTSSNISNYVNGALASSATMASVGTTTQNTNIGMILGTSKYFNGTIDEVRIYDRAIY